jgi:hypothetical protein
MAMFLQRCHLAMTEDTYGWWEGFMRYAAEISLDAII